MAWTPAAGSPIADGQHTPAARSGNAIGNQFTPATVRSQPTVAAPEWASGHVPLAPYNPEPLADIIDEIVNLHRRRQAVIRAKTKVILMMKAEVRSLLCRESDFEEDKTTDRKTAYGKTPRKLTKAAQKRVDDAIKEALAEIAAGMPVGLVASTIQSYVQSEEMFESQQDAYKKQLVKHAKRLPVYEWVKGVPGFGDVSFATIVGECGDVGTYKSVSAVWKRLGLAVINGRRQGNPGEGATAQVWIDHGYNRARRSVSYVAREHVIGGMGKWRPEYGSNLGDATYYQRVYAERARYEAAKLGMPIERSDKGKESYKKHVAMRAHRYVEKRLLKHLYLEWRRA
ncbi:hypothetical protein [Aquamicrobium soli]|uniref:Uncharacterized protein n=1 Tax=Aquamicrobium soli TaxID=1811518 RepID=A0ABV7KCU8_9HYPH